MADTEPPARIDLTAVKKVVRRVTEIGKTVHDGLTLAEKLHAHYVALRKDFDALLGAGRR